MVGENEATNVFNVVKCWKCFPVLNLVHLGRWPIKFAGMDLATHTRKIVDYRIFS